MTTTTAVLVIATFFMATGGLLFEIFLGAFGSYLFGDSVRVFSLTMGLYMFAMGIGAFSVKPLHVKPLRTLFVIEGVLIALHLLAPLAVWQAFIWGSGATVLFWTSLLLSGILVGAEIPLVLAVLRGQKGSSDAHVHQVLAADYLGALIASLSFGFYLLQKSGLLGAAAFAAAMEALAMVLLVVFVYMSGEFTKGRRLALGAFALISLLITVGVYFQSHRLQSALEAKWISVITGASKVLHSEWSGYSHINVVQFKHPQSQRTEHALILDRQFQWNTGPDLIQYHEMLTVPVVESFKRQSGGLLPQSALILGGGDGFVAERLNRLYQIKDITIVDIDPRIRALALEMPFWHERGGWVFDEPWLKYYPTDAFRFVLNQKEAHSYDLVVFDLPDPSSAGLARFYTQGFFAKVKRLLREHGHLAIQSSYQAQNPGGRRNYVCSLQNGLRAAGFHSSVLIGDEMDFYVLGALESFQWPQADEKLPGEYFDRGEKISWFLTDSLSRFGENCQDVAVNHLLRPVLLDF